MEKTFWARVFPDTRSLVTNALFDKGYRRWLVKVLLFSGVTHEAVVWAKDRERVRQHFQAKADVVYVAVEELPISQAAIYPIGNGAAFGGDIVLTDDNIEAHEQAARQFVGGNGYANR